MYVERSMTVDKCNTNYVTFIGYERKENKLVHINQIFEFLWKYPILFNVKKDNLLLF